MPLSRRRLLLCLTALFSLSTQAEPRYDRQPVKADRPVYRLAVHPLYNPAKLAETYMPLIDLLNRQIPAALFELEASRDYQMFETKLRQRQPELLLPNPWQTLQALKVGYQVIAMAGDAADFKGLILVRKDSPIRKPADLKGKVVSYPSPTALAACIMPQDFLQQHQVDVMRDLDNRYVGSQESSIMNVYLGQSAAGATWPPPWRLFQQEHPKEAAQLKVMWETPSLVNNSLMVRNDVPATIRDQVLQVALGLKQSEEGRAILQQMQTSAFYPASDNSYKVVRDYVQRFERDVRPVEQ